MLLRPTLRLLGSLSSGRGHGCGCGVVARLFSQQARATQRVPVSQFGKVKVVSRLPVVISALDARFFPDETCTSDVNEAFLQVIRSASKGRARKERTVDGLSGRSLSSFFFLSLFSSLCLSAISSVLSPSLSFEIVA